jgi:hypothetical protein
MLEALVGFVGTIVAALIGGFVALRSRGPRFVKPELVDVSFTSGLAHEGNGTAPVPVSMRDDTDGTVILDVKLRNPGAQPIFVVRAVLEIVEAHTVPAQVHQNSITTSRAPRWSPAYTMSSCRFPTVLGRCLLPMTFHR